MFNRPTPDQGDEEQALEQKTVMLVGLPLFPPLEDTQSPCIVITGQTTGYRAPNPTRALFEYLVQPHTLEEAKGFLVENSIPASIIPDLVEHNKAVVLSGDIPLRLLGSMTEHLLLPNNKETDPPHGEEERDNERWIRGSDPEDPGEHLCVSVSTMEVMLHPTLAENMPEALDRAVAALGLPVEEIAESVWHDMASLTAFGYALISPVIPDDLSALPDPPVMQQTSKQTGQDEAIADVYPIDRNYGRSRRFGLGKKDTSRIDGYLPDDPSHVAKEWPVPDSDPLPALWQEGKEDTDGSHPSEWDDFNVAAWPN